ncbi:N/A [soil metagenome]
MSAPDRDTATTIGPITRVIGLLRPHAGSVVWAGVLMLVVTAAALARPQLVAIAIDDGMRGGSATALRWAVGGYAALVLVDTIGGGWQRYALVRIGVRVITDLRNRLFRHLLGLSPSFHDRNRPGDLMSRMTADAETLSDFITWSVISILQSALVLVGIVVILLQQDLTLTLASFAVVPLMALATLRWTRATRARYKRVREAVGDVSARAEESLSGIRVVKGLGQETAQQDRFEIANQHQRREDLGTDKVSAAFYPVIDVLSDIAVAVVLGLGGLRVLSGDLDPGALVAIILYVQQFFDPVRELTTRLDSVQDAAAASRRILEVLDTEAEIVDRPDAVELTDVRGHLRLEDVRFRYATGGEVLHGVDLDVPAGTTLALVGETGAGKTSISRLLGRFYDVTGGRVLVDGHDVRDVTLGSLRTQLAWVPQEVGLFTGTVADNLRWGRPDATEGEIRAAAAAVGADELFLGMMDGYETVLDEGGGGLSAGERQLVAFTRALLTDPAVVVLDEATASVDVATEARMHEGLRRLLAGRTAFVIAHRLSTIVGADQIAVVHDGRIAERGTHAELRAAGGRYAALYDEQMAAQGMRAEPADA